MTALHILVDTCKKVLDLCHWNRYTVTITDDNDDVWQ